MYTNKSVIAFSLHISNSRSKPTGLDFWYDLFQNTSMNSPLTDISLGGKDNVFLVYAFEAKAFIK